jgi:hypothetical protein
LFSIREYFWEIKSHWWFNNILSGQRSVHLIIGEYCLLTWPKYIWKIGIINCQNVLTTHDCLLL